MGKESVGILFILLISVLLIDFVGAETVAERLFGNFGSTELSKFFTSKFFTIEGGFVKFLLFMLVTLVVYSISPFLPFATEKPFVSLLISVIVGILATFSLQIEEINTILLSYTALGIVISAIIPFFAIAAISFKSYEKGNIFISKFLWVVFIIVIVMRILYVDVSSIGEFGYYSYVFIGLAALVMVFIERRLWRLFFREETLAQMDRWYRKTKLAAAKTEIDAAAVEGRMRPGHGGFGV
ncbi:hypothetical protein HYV50_04520 [Candidatus Pacearchaeota archaeon]|nr:hypothetical protein [Candidatus Pacearchaeota archaeon]